MTGRLVVVATPIGNLEDLSPRARRELTQADLVMCEDTRRAGRLYQLAGLSPRPRFQLVDDHTEAAAAAGVADRLAGGQRIALMTDAGMPGVADPGGRVVRAAIAAGATVEVVPGPSAFLVALVLSGFDSGRFCFEGFLPRKGEARAARLDVVARERRTTILYEAPQRITNTLADLSDACGPDRRACVSRELTKRHEEVWRGRLGEAAASDIAGAARGEYAVVVEGAPSPPAPDDEAIRAAVRAELATGASQRDAAAAVAKEMGLSRRVVYQIAVSGID